MKKYIIQLDDDLSAIYEDIAKINQKSTEEAFQIILKRVIHTILRDNTKITPKINIPKEKLDYDFF